jgi:hypothetical protein
MDKVIFAEIEGIEKETYAIIEHEDGSFTSMLKSTYDELKANEATVI